MAEFVFEVEIATSVRVTIEAESEQEARDVIECVEDAALTGEAACSNVVATEVTDSDRSITLITLTEQETA